MKKGFTLIEMLITVSIMGILVLFFIPKADELINESKIKQSRTNGKVLETMIMDYYIENNDFPIAQNYTPDAKVEDVIRSVLIDKNLDDTVEYPKLSFSTIDSAKLKNKSLDVSNYFFVSDGILKGSVFGKSTLTDKNKNIYSANYSKLYDLSLDETIRLPLIGSGTSSNPYVVMTVGELQGTNLCLSCNFQLGKNIDATNTKNWNNGSGFQPIGNSANFTGSFDGKGYKIKNLTINRPSKNRVGLFGSIKNTSGSQSIKNIKIENGSIKGNEEVGLLIGFIDFGSYPAITNNHVSGTINASGYYTGGLIGNANAANVSNSSSSGVINHPFGYYIGGLIGHAGDSTVTFCHSSMDVITTGSGGAQTGGLIGSLTNSTISKSYATGNVSGVYQDSGSFVGASSSSTISESYATGNITANNQGHIGGFIGKVSNSTILNNYAFGQVKNGDVSAGFIGNIGTLGSSDKISYNFSTGVVFGKTQSGGFSGIVDSSSLSKIINNFWDTTSSGISSSTSGTGKSTLELKNDSTYTGWDFTSTWSINSTINNAYPYLQNNVPK